MNKAYRLIWNELTQSWVAVSELVKARGKRASGVALLTALGFILGPVWAADPAPTALPTGGQITAGQGSISQTGASMTINQNTERMIANWQSFNIGSNASVNFVQPNSSSTALNRVSGQSATQILGRLTANGQVILINPAGVLFTKSAQVDVGGLVATTLNMSDANFLAGKHQFEGNGGSVVNQGRITTPSGGRVALIAPVVRNEGTIEAPQGSVALAAGQAVDIDLTGDGGMVVRITKGALDALVENKGAIRADDGTVILGARALDQLARAAVNNEGIIAAQGIRRQGGRIMLDAGDAGHVSNTGTLDVSSQAHAGGTIEITSKTVELAGKLDASGTSGGEVRVNALAELNAGAHITAIGVAGAGGTVLATASSATFAPGSIVDASGTSQGGTIGIETTQVLTSQGQIVAGSEAGTGGSVTLASAGEVRLEGARVDASGANHGGAIRIQATPHEVPHLPADDPTQPPSAPPTVAITGNSLLSSRGRQGQGGTVTLTGEQIEIQGITLVDASGATGGGTVRIGGDWQGGHDLENPLPESRTVTIGADVVIDASASETGDGGTVVAWSTENTVFEGEIRARGGRIWR